MSTVFVCDAIRTTSGWYDLHAICIGVGPNIALIVEPVCVEKP